ncbi:lipopolysaccharide kinase InaA family protein [Planctomycetota bacterium]
MSEFPFQLSVTSVYPEKKTVVLTCKSVLREVPGSRVVYDAAWDGRDVIVKQFLHKLNGSIHLKKEWGGLSKLRDRQLNAPEPLFYGKSQAGPVLVMAKIPDPLTAMDVFLDNDGRSNRLDLLKLICSELARQHRQGVLQKDLHLGNFLLSDDKVFAIDSGQMKFVDGEVSREKSISQLASLLGCIGGDDTAMLDEIVLEYTRIRGWRFDETDKVLLQKLMAIHKRSGIKRALKKLLRTTRRYLKIKTDGYLGVFDRGFCEKDMAVKCIKQIDELMDGGQILKDGNTCYVSRVNFNGKDIVIKRYNHKGFIYSLRHTIKRSRARRGWVCGHLLEMLGIDTPKPLAYIERRKGPIVWTSYIVTEFVDGENLYTILSDDTISPEKRSQMSEQIIRILEKLESYKVTHGDLKRSNIMVTETGSLLTDLDSMMVHRLGWLFNIKRKKDLLSVESFGFDR